MNRLFSNLNSGSGVSKRIQMLGAFFFPHDTRHPHKPESGIDHIEMLSSQSHPHGEKLPMSMVNNTKVTNDQAFGDNARVSSVDLDGFCVTISSSDPTCGACSRPT